MKHYPLNKLSNFSDFSAVYWHQTVQENFELAILTQHQPVLQLTARSLWAMTVNAGSVYYQVWYK